MQLSHDATYVRLLSNREEHDASRPIIMTTLSAADPLRSNAQQVEHKSQYCDLPARPLSACMPCLAQPTTSTGEQDLLYSVLPSPRDVVARGTVGLHHIAGNHTQTPNVQVQHPRLMQRLQVKMAPVLDPMPQFFRERPWGKVAAGQSSRSLACNHAELPRPLSAARYAAQGRSNKLSVYCTSAPSR